MEHGTLLGANTLAIYDKSNNLLIIDKELFLELSSMQQRQLLRSHNPVTVIERKDQCSNASGMRFAAE